MGGRTPTIVACFSYLLMHLKDFELFLRSPKYSESQHLVFLEIVINGSGSRFIIVLQCAKATRGGNQL